MSASNVSATTFSAARPAAPPPVGRRSKTGVRPAGPGAIVGGFSDAPEGAPESAAEAAGVGGGAGAGAGPPHPARAAPVSTPATVRVVVFRIFRAAVITHGK